MRKLKVYVATDDLIGRVMTQVTLLLENVEIVDMEVEAEMIVVESVRAIGSNFSSEKFYAVICFTEEKGDLPDNVNIFKHPFELREYYLSISNILEKLDINAETSNDEVVEVELLPDARKILVVDDTPRHQKSAKRLLAGNRVTVVTGYDDAMKALSGETFDVVLSDLKLPMSSNTLGSEAFKLGQLVDYGLLISLEAARAGAKYVAVATDLNHHADCISAAFDHFSYYEFVINGAKVRYMHAPMEHFNDEWVKDWAEILKIVTAKE